LGLFPLISLLVAALANAFGTSLLKYSMTVRSAGESLSARFVLLFGGACLLFSASLPFYSYSLAKMKLSVVQPLFSSIIYLGIAVTAVLVFHESYSPLKIAGLAVILVGITMVANG